jgi:DNA-binding FrmR family transcriptional regulator
MIPRMDGNRRRADRGWSADKSRLDARLARVEGQVRAIRAMIAADHDCERVVQQLAAARKALDRSFYELVACVLRRELGPHGGGAAPQIEHLSTLLARYG